jgi:putative holliday junction resolvase
MRRGVRLGVDVGRARVGVARCDQHGILATPVATLDRRDDLVASIRLLVEEFAAIEVVVGLPISLRGDDTASTQDSRNVAQSLASALPDISVRLVDERLTTVTAARALRDSGRTAKTSRSVVDQVAAVILLQHALDHEKARGTPPGAVVDSDGGLQES